MFSTASHFHSEQCTLIFFNNINDNSFVFKLYVISHNFYLSFFFHILQEFYPTDKELGYIMDLSYNAFFCFEMIYESSLDDVVCGICRATLKSA